jgi:hypothetical protein
MAASMPLLSCFPGPVRAASAVSKRVGCSEAIIDSAGRIKKLGSGRLAN